MARLGRTAVWLLIILGSIAVFLWGVRFHTAPVAPTFESSGPTISQLEKLGDLVAIRVHVADVLTAAEGTYKGAWLIKGDALIAVDMNGAKLVEKNVEQKHAIISLPAPRVIQPRVDHAKTKTWSVQDTTFVPGWIPFVGSKGDPDQLRDAAMAQAQLLVERAANLDESLDQAREIASGVITNMYRLVDWQVEIRWQDKHGAK